MILRRYCVLKILKHLRFFDSNVTLLTVQLVLYCPASYADVVGLFMLMILCPVRLDRGRIASVEHKSGGRVASVCLHSATGLLASACVHGSVKL